MVGGLVCQQQEIITQKRPDYFKETEMITTLKEFKNSNSSTAFEKLNSGIDLIINGMINKEFNHNSYIISNRHDAMSTCKYEILKSFKKYDPDKGRLFAYINRIVKNTLLKFQRKDRRYKEHEISYTSLMKNVDDEDCGNDDIVFNMANSDVNDDVEQFDSSSTITPHAFNLILDIDDSIYIIYNYIKYIDENIKYFINNKSDFDLLSKNISKDAYVNFDLDKYQSNNKIMFKKNNRYFIILQYIDKFISRIKRWLELTYPKFINKEPKHYKGEISPRAEGILRKFVNDNLNNDELLNKFDSYDIINFINYIIRYHQKI